MGETQEPFIKPLRFGFIDIVERDFREAVETKEQVELWKRPRNDVHVRASVDSPDEAREAREEAPEQELEPRPGKPHIGSRDDELPAGGQVFARRLEEEVGTAKMLEAFAADNGLVTAEIAREAQIEIDVPK